MIGIKGMSTGLIGGRNREALLGGLRNIGTGLQVAGSLGSLYNPAIGLPVAKVGSLLKNINK